jgi:hypothetical protein
MRCAQVKLVAMLLLCSIVCQLAVVGSYEHKGLGATQTALTSLNPGARVSPCLVLGVFMLLLLHIALVDVGWRAALYVYWIQRHSSILV